MNTITIIGISGITGAGKTTLVKLLSEQLKASCLFWDDFDDISFAPDDYVAWFKQGQDYTEFNYEQLAQSLRELKNGNSITHPVTGKKIPAKPYIIVDAPLGKVHKQTAQYFDLVIHIDTPLDIALARRLIRDAQNPAMTKESLIHDLRYYLTQSRPLFAAEGMSLIANSADYVIDGAEDCDRQVARIIDFISSINTSVASKSNHNIKIEMADDISDAIKNKMSDSFIAYEAKNGIDVNYKKFSLVMSDEKDNVIAVLNAYTAFSEIYVDDMWVDAAYRNKGYGRILLHDLETRFKEMGFNNINLVTSDFQAPEFYKKCGYKAEFRRINEKNPKLTKTFFVKFFGEESQGQGTVKVHK